MLNTPVALIIFRRPAVTQRVLQAIAQARPRKLLVVADGPRPDRPQDVKECAATRAVIEQVDWDCEVMKHYAETNLGCGRRPGTGITWVFQQVEEAIILEDDCLPNPSFFRFCQELLERYRHDERVMHIAGSNFQRHGIDKEFSYHFSCFNTCWGWATWRRAWRHFDMELKLWPRLRDTTWLDHLVTKEGANLWRPDFQKAYDQKGNVSFWDHQWSFACWSQNGLSVAPNCNLVSNIGFNKDATHTLDEKDYRAHLSSVEMEFPLRHPPMVLRNTESDHQIVRELLRTYARPQPSGYQKMRARISNVLPAPLKKTLRWALGRA